MFKTQDGVLCSTLKEALAHEKTTYFKQGMTPLLERLIGGVAPADAIASVVESMALDEALLGDFRKFFTKLPTTDQSATVARKRTKPAKKTAAPDVPAVAPSPAETTVADPAPPFVPSSSEPTDAELDALTAMAGNPIVISEEGAPPPP